MSEYIVDVNDSSEMYAAEMGRYEELRELIRCKECKHWYRDADTGMACEFTNLWQPEEGFCNWAEKKFEEPSD